jgi:hypothetical protein
MTVPMVELMGYRCERCEHEWLPRERDRAPKVCPKCKSPYWDVPRRTMKEYAANESALMPRLGVPEPRDQKYANRVDGTRVAYFDDYWQCGCVGLRNAPGDIVMLRPCHGHRREIESLRLPSSRSV